MKTKKPARERICRAQESRILPIPETMEERWGKGTMLIPAPLELEALIREIPKGIVVSVLEIRHELARRHHVDMTCPLVTELYWRMIAEAALEDDRDGVEDVTPYWRVVRDDGSLNAKLPGGIRVQADRLLLEGHLLLRSRVSQRLRVPFQSEDRPPLWLKASGFSHF
jgi:hypothetical protein